MDINIEEMSKKVGEKVSDFTQTAVVKGKELTETAKIMLAVRSAKDKIKTAQVCIGQYVAENRLLQDDPTVAALYEEIDGYTAEIAEGEQRIRNIRGQVKCPGCGAVLPLHQLYCDKCGTKVPEPEPAPAEEAAPVEEAPAATPAEEAAPVVENATPVTPAEPQQPAPADVPTMKFPWDN